MELFREMDYVYAVYVHKSFSKAAEAMFLSQSSLSLMVKKAERRIGAPIFDRSSLPVTLTEPGEAYIRAVEQIRSVTETFRSDVDSLNNCLSGRLALGGTTLFTSYILAPSLSAFAGQFPRVDLFLHEAGSDLLQEELLSGALDFVVDNGRLDKKLFSRTPILDDELLLAVPSAFRQNRAALDYRLSPALETEQASPVPLELFSDADFLLLKRGNDTRERADALIDLAELSPTVRLQTDHQIVAYNFAAEGMGCTFVSRELVRRLSPDGRLCFYACDAKLSRQTISLFSKKNRIHTRPMEEFLETVKRTVSGGR